MGLGLGVGGRAWIWVTVRGLRVCEPLEHLQELVERLVVLVRGHLQVVRRAPGSELRVVGGRW